jgi:hypothetical protein
MLNARQIAFARLVKLFTEVLNVVPSGDITEEQIDAAGQELKKQITAIMDEYDRSVLTGERR